MALEEAAEEGLVLVADGDGRGRRPPRARWAQRSRQPRYSSGTVALFEMAAGLAHPARRRSDFFFLDIGLLDLDGYEVARRLRAMPATRTALLVAVTGWGQLEDQRRSQEAGFDQHLVKPLDPRALDDLLTSYSEGSSGLKNRSLHPISPP